MSSVAVRLAAVVAAATAAALMVTPPRAAAVAPAPPDARPAGPATPPRSPSLPPITRPEDPTAQVAVESEVVFPAGDVDLAGTLALPPTGKPPFPAVLLVPGGAFEPFDRDANYHGIKLFRQIAQRLAAHGVASLRYDKRGVGKSKGRLAGATIESLAADAGAALAFLRGRAEVDRRAVSALGHGEGATVLLAAVADPRRPERDLAGTILLAASSARGDEAVMENWRNIVETWPNTNDQNRAQAVDQQLRVIAAVRAGSGLGKFSPMVIAQAETPFFKSLIDFDPKPYLTRLRAPVLIVHGQRDRQVSADHALKIKSHLTKSGNRNVTLVVDPYVNHLLAQCKTGHIKEYGALGSKADAETIERIADWAERTLRKRRAP